MTWIITNKKVKIKSNVKTPNKIVIINMVWKQLNQLTLHSAEIRITSEFDSRKKEVMSCKLCPHWKMINSFNKNNCSSFKHKLNRITHYCKILMNKNYFKNRQIKKHKIKISSNNNFSIKTCLTKFPRKLI